MLFFVNSLDSEEGNEMKFQYLCHNCTVYQIKSVLKTVFKFVFTEVTQANFQSC